MIEKKKIAIICSTDYTAYPMGGMMSFILDLLPYMEEHYDVSLWGVTSSDQDIQPTIVSGGKSYSVNTFAKVKVAKKIIPNMLRVVFGAFRARRRILEEGYDALYFHGIPLSLPFLLVKTNRRKPKVVNHVHGMTNPFAMTANVLARNFVSIRLYDLYRRYTVRKSDLILLASDQQGHSQFSENHLASADKIKYVPNFADTTIFGAQDKRKAKEVNGLSGQLVLVNTGRISLQKDPLLLLRSFQHLVDQLGVDAKLVMIGDGELMGDVVRFSKEHGLDGRIIFTGNISRTEISKWLNAADLYVYTSHANGFPISLAEAAVSALPIVTTDVTGVHDLVVDDVSGFLVKERDPRSMAVSIMEALKKKDDFSNNIHGISKMFAPEVIASKINDQFTLLLR